MKFIIKLLKFIFVPEGERAKSAYILLFIFFAAFMAFGLNFPAVWNRYAEKWHAPKFRVLDFKFGLDVKGGTQLIYLADLSGVRQSEHAEAMASLRDVIERRVNIFGISEPNIQTARAGEENRLIVELAGVSDVAQAIAMIGQTPYLEFKESRSPEETKKIQEAQKSGTRAEEDPYFVPTGLNGKYLRHSEVIFDTNTNKPTVNLQFNAEGAKLFEEITARNIGKMVAIYLDGGPVSIPRVNDAISGGQAVISGDFNVKEAKELVRRLNSGALSAPVRLISQRTIESSLGVAALKKSFKAGLWAMGIVAIFMVLWYRVPGALAIIALFIYAIFTLAAFKLLGVTLTLAGIVGFILSIGMAVDANILIFSRMQEEFRAGKRFDSALHEAFARAWPSVRDSNASTLLTCFVLYFFTASLVKGFALTLALGVVVSMFSSIFVTRLLLKTVAFERLSKSKLLWYR